MSSACWLCENEIQEDIETVHSTLNNKLRRFEQLLIVNKEVKHPNDEVFRSFIIQTDFVDQVTKIRRKAEDDHGGMK